MHPNISSEERHEANQTLEKWFAENNAHAGADAHSRQREPDPFSAADALNSASLLFMTLTSLITAAVYVGIPSVICALCFRRGLILLVLGLIIVKKDGSTASRLRVFCRSLITWAPAFVLPLFVFGPPVHRYSVPYQTFGYAIILLWIGLAVGPAILASRSIQDRLCGTWLVPK
jgi:hypothetical protein